jgi:ribosomal protein L37AE/L43A
MIDEIKKWPSVFPPIFLCKNCKDGAIRRNPSIETEWGCANCGNDTIGPSIGFEVDPEKLKTVKRLVGALFP